jgi:ubiquinol oxidase
MERGNGTMIQEMLDEAVNERKHLMFFIEIAQPNSFERLLITVAQLIFWHFYLILYLISSKTAHRMIGYFEEEAVISYTNYLDLIENGQIEDVPAPQLAIEYYGLLEDAKLSDMIKYVRADEAKHAKVNHNIAGGKL